MPDKTNKHILLIAYQFPPLNVGGSERPFKLASFLPEFNVTPHVVTLDPDSYKNVYGEAARDDEMLKSLGESVDILNVPSEDLIKKRKSRLKTFTSIFFNIYRGVEYQYWSKKFHHKVDALIAKSEVKFDLVLVTAPPFGMLKLAKELAKKHQLPLVVDMRDHWTYWNMTPYSNFLNYLFTKRKEGQIFQHASKIIGVTNEQIEDFKFLHPEVAADKFKWIPNGYDAELNTNVLQFNPPENITIGYVGNFYYNPEFDNAIFTPFWKKRGHRMLQYVPRKENWKYRSPYFFFKNIKRLIDQYPELSDKIKLRFAGRKPHWFDKMVHEWNLDSQVEHVGRLTKKEVLEFQKACDFMLITSAKVMDGLDYCIAGKSFEHIGLEKPILGFVTPGAQKNFLEQSGMSSIFDPDELDANAQKLHQLFTNGEKYQPNIDFLKKFHRRSIALKMSEVIHDVCSRQNANQSNG